MEKIDLESGSLEFMVDGKFAGKIEDNLIKKYFGGSSSVFMDLLVLLGL